VLATLTKKLPRTKKILREPAEIITSHL